MAHSGGIIAAGLGKGRIPWFSRDIKVRHFSVPFLLVCFLLIFQFLYGDVRDDTRRQNILIYDSHLWATQVR